jgi:hypothetical protein
MKKAIWILLVFIGLSSTLQSQHDSLPPRKETRLSALYITYTPFSLIRRFSFFAESRDVNSSITAFLSNGIGSVMAWRVYDIKAKNIPSDFKGGLFAFIFEPTEIISIYAFRGLYMLPLPEKKLRIGFEAGPALVRYEKAVFYKVSDPTNGWGPNYDYYLKPILNYGASFKFKFEYDFTRYFGLEYSMAVNYSPYDIDVIPDLGINIGFVRKKIKPSTLH